MAKRNITKHPFTHDLVREVIKGMLEGDSLPSKDLREALAKASGKSEIEIYQMVGDIHSQRVGHIEDPYVPTAPIMG